MLRVFYNRVLRGIFGPWEATGSWRKLHNVELQRLNSSADIIIFSCGTTVHI
jgi:hypothetical protein